MVQTNTESIHLRSCAAQWPYSQSIVSKVLRAMSEVCGYANLENPETRQFATDDPKGFLARFEGAVILDEIQRVPELLSYIQTIVDTRQRNGQFVLTGSHQLGLREAITQSLAGRR